MNKKSLFDKIEDLIEKHISEIVDKKMSLHKKSIEIFIEKEIAKTPVCLSKKYKNVNKIKLDNIDNRLFKDVFGTYCLISKINQDHVMPKKVNGAGAKSNLMWICKESNETKRDNLEGIVNGTKYKVSVDKNFDLKTGKSVGTLSIYDNNQNIYIQKSTRKENNKFIKFKTPIE